MNQNCTKWVTAWGNAISISERRPENYSKNLTLRYPIKMMIDGTALRITIDNFCGTEPITVSSVSVAKSDENGNIDVNTVQDVKFNGCESVTVNNGERLKSDVIEMSVSRGENIAVSLYFADFTEMRSGVLITGNLSKGFFAIGNQIKFSSLEKTTSKKTNWFYFLSDVEVLTSDEKHTVICYGDSITAQAWPDYLIQRTLNEGDGNTAIIRKAVSGTRILRQYDNITYDSYGLKGNIRFPREVPFTSGADVVIIQHGINDIIHPVGEDVNCFRPWSDLPTAQEMIDGIRSYIKIARENNMTVYLGTLLPIEGWRTYADFREKLRNDVNEWIRNTDEADGCIDFDLALCDLDNPSYFASGFDSGDHLHPSQTAYQKMADVAYEYLNLRKNA